MENTTKLSQHSTQDDDLRCFRNKEDQQTKPCSSNEPPPQTDISKSDVIDGLKKSLRQLFLQARDGHSLPESTAKDITLLGFEALQQFNTNYLCLIKTTLKKFDIDEKLVLDNVDISNCFEDIPSLINANLMTILHEHFNFVSPVEIDFPNTDDKLYYVPIRETIQSISTKLNFEADCDVFMNSKHMSEYFSLLADKAIYIKLYTDEFEVCNPIGVSRKKHKIIAVYFSFLNLPEEFESKLDSHFLVCLSNERLYKSNKETFFNPLVEELNSLYFDEVSVGDWRRAVIAVALCGDNLSIHNVIGLGKQFSSGYICRFCMIQFNDLASFGSTTADKRSNQSYDFDYTIFSHGIREQCSFRKIIYVNFKYFFPPDFMHDLLEGVSHSVISLILSELLKKVSVDAMNEILNNHDFGVSIPCLSRYNLRNMKLPLKAADVLKLLSVLPLIVGNWFEKDEPAWRLLLIHCDLLSWCFRNGNNVPEDYLTAIIIEHNNLIYDLSPDKKPKYKCKLHYLTHYPVLMKHYGSLKFYWNIRFEGLHQYFKRLLRITRQFRNVAFTCALRYQMHRAASNSFQNKGYCIVPNDIKQSSILSSLTYEEVTALNLYLNTSLDFNEVLHSSTSVKCVRNSYDLTVSSRHASCIATFDSMNCDYSFFSIENIVKVHEEWLVLVKRLSVINHPHFSCFTVISKTMEYEVIPLSLIHHAPLTIRIVRCLQCICLPLNYPL